MHTFADEFVVVKQYEVQMLLLTIRESTRNLYALGSFAVVTLNSLSFSRFRFLFHTLFGSVSIYLFISLFRAFSLAPSLSRAVSGFKATDAASGRTLIPSIFPPFHFSLHANICAIFTTDMERFEWKKTKNVGGQARRDTNRRKLVGA